jgi:hypothetical protein
MADTPTIARDNPGIAAAPSGTLGGEPVRYVARMAIEEDRR